MFSGEISIVEDLEAPNCSDPTHLPNNRLLLKAILKKTGQDHRRKMSESTSASSSGII